MTILRLSVEWSGMERTYQRVVREHFARHRQMVFVTGPRQVGKTHLSLAVEAAADRRYLSWDSFEDRDLMLAGPRAVAEELGLERAREQPLLVVFDELHKYSRWKPWLKGFHDRYKERCNVLVTGSARLDVFRKGGDSLMGRYFNYRLHPFSVAELLGAVSLDGEHSPPQPIPDLQYESLLRWVREPRVGCRNGAPPPANACCVGALPHFLTSRRRWGEL